MEKIFLVDKAVDWTSFDVVAKIRGALKQATGQRVKVGHAGTLDPFATGLLIVLIGEATKKQNEFMKLDKEYQATFILGAESSTDDRTGVISSEAEKSSSLSNRSLHSDRDDTPSIEEVLAATKELTGKISQTPPKFSAIKVNGTRAYKLARNEQEFELEARPVEIKELRIMNYEYPKLELAIRCSSGTYIRSLARDLGIKLKTGCYVDELRRTRIGEFTIENAKSIDEAISYLLKD